MGKRYKPKNEFFTQLNISKNKIVFEGVKIEIRIFFFHKSVLLNSGGKGKTYISRRLKNIFQQYCMAMHSGKKRENIIRKGVFFF